MRTTDTGEATAPQTRTVASIDRGKLARRRPRGRFDLGQPGVYGRDGRRGPPGRCRHVRARLAGPRARRRGSGPRFQPPYALRS